MLNLIFLKHFLVFTGVYLSACIFIPLWLLFVSFDWPFYEQVVGLSDSMIAADSFPLYGKMPKFNDYACPGYFHKAKKAMNDNIQPTSLNTALIDNMTSCEMIYENAKYFEQKTGKDFLPSFASGMVFDFVSTKNVLLFGSMFGNLAIMAIIPLLAREEIKKNIWWLIYCIFADKKKKYWAAVFAVLDLFITIWCSFMFVWSVTCYYKWYTYDVFDIHFPKDRTNIIQVKQWVLRVITINLFALLMNIPGFLILTEFDERILAYFSDQTADGLKKSDLFTTKLEKARIKQLKRNKKSYLDEVELEKAQRDPNTIVENEKDSEEISWKPEQRFFAYKIISYYNLLYLIVFLALTVVTLEPYGRFFLDDVKSFKEQNGMDDVLNMENVLKYKVKMEQTKFLKTNFGDKFMKFLKKVNWPNEDTAKMYRVSLQKCPQSPLSAFILWTFLQRHPVWSEMDCNSK